MLSTLQAKIDDLRAKVESNSISPAYLAAILDEMVGVCSEIKAIADEGVEGVDTLTESLAAAVAELQEAIDTEKSQRLSNVSTLGTRVHQNELSITAISNTVQSIQSSMTSLSTSLTSETTRLEASITASRELRHFDGVFSGPGTPTIHSQSTVAEPDAVLYLPAKATFIARKGAQYFAYWADASDMAAQGSPDGWVPSSAFLYVCRSSSRLYLWSGSELLPVDDHTETKADRALECLAGLSMKVISEERYAELSEADSLDENVLYLIPEDE